MGVTKEEGAKRIFFEHPGEKQYWIGKESSLMYEFPKCNILEVSDIN